MPGGSRWAAATAPVGLDNILHDGHAQTHPSGSVE
jgi:hypothetical protein